MLEFINPNLDNIEVLENNYIVKKTDSHSGVNCYKFSLQKDNNLKIRYYIDPIKGQCSIANIHNYSGFIEYNFAKGKYKNKLKESYIEDLKKIVKGLNYTKIFISFKKIEFKVVKNILLENGFVIVDSYKNKRTSNEITILECVV